MKIFVTINYELYIENRVKSTILDVYLKAVGVKHLNTTICLFC